MNTTTRTNAWTTLAMVLLAVASVTVLCLCGPLWADKHSVSSEPPPLEQFIFLAVLEGLYLDGVSTDDVEQILRKDEQGRYQHFIYGCPLCMPALDACRVYFERPGFYSRKVPRDTLGNGLDPFLSKRLRSREPKERLDVLNTLIVRWVGRRFDTRVLSEAQRQALEAQIAEGVKRGEEMLGGERAAGRAGIFSGGSRCAVCEGSRSAYPKKK